MLIKLLIFYCAVLLIATICGLINYKKMGPSSKIMVWYVAATFAFETTATLAGYFLKYNLLIYQLYSYLQLFLICLYFHSTSLRFRNNKAILIVGIIGISLGIIGALLQRENENISAHLLVLEAYLIIGMSLHSFLELLGSDELDMNRNPQFWFSALFMIFWTFTFFYWLVGLTIRAELPENGVWMDIMIWTINILTYAGFALVFFFYKKMRTT